MTKHVEEAFRYAARAHLGQVRKNSGVPYITHPMYVAMMVARAYPDEAIVMAAVLHDVLEDTPITYEQLQQDMGRPVANLVAAMTENKRLPWMARKVEKVERVCAMGDGAKIICLADNYHNMLCTLADLKVRDPGPTKEVFAKHNFAMSQCRMNSTNQAIIWLHSQCVEVYEDLQFRRPPV